MQMEWHLGSWLSVRNAKSRVIFRLGMCDMYDPITAIGSRAIEECLTRNCGVGVVKNPVHLIMFGLHVLLLNT